MRPCRLHLTGASGTGTTTLGRAIATEWSVPHADADDYYWMPTAPAFTTKRATDDRLQLMRAVFTGRESWVLSGSVMGWGDRLIPLFDAVVFLTLDSDTRLRRLRDRETIRYGARLEPNGDREHAHHEFMAWAQGYDDPTFTGRNLARHEQWLADLSCPVIRLDATGSVDELLAAVTAIR
ncbi:hypothetical protein EK0264_00130 [Epidermidibacterium keratini]|uniref:AAA family ATPase n=1 Tax=Epidermidibacterium keratini TaxID=1891644 RepID=A0A7M3T513_9ACTN|nr:hypothetical protein [Epidermidibacterium keratini]QHB98865.1 hypothetical protein EK0264_00130 [Epidermidibacterium keratini]